MTDDDGWLRARVADLEGRLSQLVDLAGSCERWMLAGEPLPDEIAHALAALHGVPAAPPPDLLPPEERARRTRLAWWADLTNEHRLALIGQCCASCGSLDPRCRCGDDS